jgi:hypothetical protein
MPQGKFHVGDHVNHAESQDGKLPGGTGFIVEVIPPDGGDGCKYKVKCDKTNTVLPNPFNESDLSLV